MPGNRYDYFCVPHSGPMRGSVTVETGPGTFFCFCWPAPPCPASNRDAGAGCFNSSGVRGGRLMGAGTASAMQDDLVLATTLLPANTATILLRSSMQTADAPFLDGFICMARPHLRVKQMISSATGAVSYGPGLVARTQTSFMPITSGQSWYFQVWYHDTSGPCATLANITNGYTVAFAP